MLNKMYDLGGIDDIAFMNLWSGINNNAGKTMGLTVGIFIIINDGKATNCIRDYFKNYNNGNIEKQIEGSEYYVR